MDKINVLYTTDHNYVKCMLVSLYSLLENNSHIDITVHIICDKFELKDYKKIEYVISEFKNSNVYFHSFENISRLIEEYNIPNWRGTQIANARVFFTSCIKDTEQLLYLDSDTIVVSALSGLQTYDGAIHMVQDSMPTSHWQNLSVPLEKYCNSGVLWIDVNKWKEKGCDKKLSDMLEKDISYTYPDQDLLNMALRDEIELLPPEYNLFSTDAYYNSTFLQRFYKQAGIERYSINEIKNAKNNPIILHGTPFYNWSLWDGNNIHPYAKIYDEYLYKLFGKANNKQVVESPNQLIFKLYLYSKLACPQKIKNTAKKLTKNFQRPI